jgi:DNA-binding SARP family transcriptional activator/WD40 repeat protein
VTVTNPQRSGPPEASDIQVRLMGSVSVTDGAGRRIDIGGPKPRLVLVHMALNPERIVPAESLIDTLWGEDPPPTARRSLQAHVAKLRSALGGADGPLQPVSPGYVLRIGRSQVDVLSIEDRMRQARSIADADPAQARELLASCRDDWVGEPLADLVDHDPTLPIRRQLEMLGRDLADLELDVLLATGDHAEVIRRLERLVGDEPDHEPHWGRLMTAYYRSGRQVDALEAYQRARTALIEGLGVEPSITLQQLEASVLAQDADLAAVSVDSCPYKGLASYQVDDGDTFFGRDQLIQQLLESLRHSRTCVVVGPSGVGKSSALRAGLAYRIGAGAAADAGLRSAAVITPGTQPLRSLYQAPETTDVLIIDQFEEIFTLTDEEDIRFRFITEALQLTPGGRARVVISIRADFYGHCAAIPMLAPLLTREQVLVPALSEQDLRDAVRLPAERVGLEVEAELVDAIVADVGDRPGALPLMSHALVETWRRRDGGRLTLAAYREAGSIAGAIATTAEQLHESLDAERRRQLERLFLRLVELGDGAIDTRRAIGRSQLDGVAVDDELIDRLVSARLLSAGTDNIEIAHEALIGAWPRLGEWIDNDRDGIRTQRQVAGAALAWDGSGRNEAELYRGPRLSGALDWADSAPGDLSDLERAFLQTSRTASESALSRQVRANRRLRGLVLVSAMAVAIAVTASLVAVGSARDADRRSDDLENARLVDAIRADDTLSQEITLRLAAAAERRVSTPASRGLLLDAILSSPGSIEHRNVAARFVKGAPTTANGGVLLAEDDRLNPQIWDSDTLEVIWRPRAETQISRLRLIAAVNTGDGLVGVEEGTLKVFDLTPGSDTDDSSPVFGPRDVDPTEVALSADGRLLAVVSDPTESAHEDSVIDVIDVRSAELRRLRDPANGAASDIQFDAVGSRVLAVLDGRAVGVWDVATGRAELRTSSDSASTRAVTRAVFASDGMAFALGRKDGAVEIWTRDQSSWQAFSLSSPHEGAVSSLEFDRSGDSLVSSSADGLVAVWDVASGEGLGPQVTLETIGGLNIFFSGESEIAGTDVSGNLWRWQIEPDVGLIVREDRVRGSLTAVDADGRREAVVERQEEGISIVVREQDVTVRRIVVADVWTPVQDVSISPDGSELVFSTADGELLWYELDGVQARMLLPAGRGFDGHFLDDDTVVAVGMGGVQLLDPGSQADAETVAIGPNAVRVAIGSSRDLAATVDLNGDVQLWDLESLQPLGAPVALVRTGDTGPISFVGDDSRLEHTGNVGTSILRVDPTDWRHIACSVLSSPVADGSDGQILGSWGLDDACD